MSRLFLKTDKIKLNETHVSQQMAIVGGYAGQEGVCTLGKRNKREQGDRVHFVSNSCPLPEYPTCHPAGFLLGPNPHSRLKYGNIFTIWT